MARIQPILCFIGLVWHCSASYAVRDGKVLFEFNTPSFKFSPENPNLSEGCIIRALDESWCENQCQGPPSGYQINETFPVAILDNDSGELCFTCGFEKLALWSQNVGAIALLQATVGIPGHMSRAWYSKQVFIMAEERRAVAMEISAVDAAVLTENYITNDTTIRLEYGENQWTEIYDGATFIILQVACALVNLVVAIFGIVRLVAFLKASRKLSKFQGPILCISIEVCGCLLRAVYCSVDPLWSRGVISFFAGRVLLSISFPISFLGSVILFLVWRRVVKLCLLDPEFDPSKHFLSGKKSKCLLALALLYFISDIVLSALTLYTGSFLDSSVATITGAINIVVALLFLYYGIRFVSTVKWLKNVYIKRTAQVGGKKDDSSLHMTYLLIVGGILFMLASVSLILNGEMGFFSFPWRRVCAFLFLNVCLGLLALVKILAFTPPSPHSPRPKLATTSSSSDFTQYVPDLAICASANI